jgi:predicted SAM-dependent methyltransferase
MARRTGWIAPGLVGLVLGMLLTVVVLRTTAPGGDASSGAEGDDAAAARPPDPALARFIERTPAAIDEYVRTHEVRKLQIGAGSSRPPGWLNSDIEPRDHLVYLDATTRFPLEDDSFHYVFSEHVIEHLTLDGGATMLAESYRVLAPGGKVRIATPDLLQLIALFRDDKSEAARQYLTGKLEWHDWPRHPTPECVILNLQLREFGHEFVYDAATLTAALQRAGFEGVRLVPLGVSDDPHLQGLEGRPAGWIGALNEYETMVLEAVKPGAAPSE